MVYILHFEKPLGHGKYGQAQYYIGYCDDNRFSERYNEHIKGYGAAITRACVERGINMYPVLLFPGKDRAFERKLKNQKNTRKIVSRYMKRLTT